MAGTVKMSTGAAKTLNERVVYGEVIYSDTGEPAANMRVVVMDADKLYADPLGEATTDDTGKFSITYGIGRFRERFSRPPDIFLSVYDQHGRLVTTTHDAVIRDTGSKQEIHVQLPRDGRLPVHAIAIGGLQVDRKNFEALTPEDVITVAHNIYTDQPDERAVKILGGLNPSLADDLLHPKLCGTPVTRFLEATVRAKNWQREVALELEDILRGSLRFGAFATYSSPPFTINYQTSGATAVNTTDSVTNIVMPGTSSVIGTTSANGVPDYVERIAFWLQRALATFTSSPFNLKSPAGTITVDVINDPGYGHGGKNHITIHYSLPDDMLAWVLVHEFMHVIQAEYPGADGEWLWGIAEGGAVFAEDTVIDGINRYAAEADCFFGEGTLRHPEYSLTSLSYKLSLFLKYLSEQQSSRVAPADEPRIGAETYRELLEAFESYGYNTAALQEAISQLPWYQSMYEFGYLDAAKLDETSSETLLGNFWLACYIKDLGLNNPDRRFDFMEDEEPALADNIFHDGVPANYDIGPMISVHLEADITLDTGGAITLSSGTGSQVSPFAARFYRITPTTAVNTLRVNFAAGAGFTRPLVQIVLVEPGNIVRDILRSDRGTWNRTIANDRSGTKLDHVIVIVAGTDTGGAFSLSVQEVPPAPDVMVTRWHHALGTHYEIDSFNWAWTWASPDIYVDTNQDGKADDVVHLNQNNKLFIRLHNEGNQAASGMQVEFWYQDASVNLQESAWLPVKNTAGITQTLTNLTLGSQSTNQWYVDWAPAPSGSSTHFCIRAVVTVPGDPNSDNKRCLSNFGNVVAPGPFIDLRWLRYYLQMALPKPPWPDHIPESMRETRILVIPRAHSNYAISLSDLDRINALYVSPGDEVMDVLRVQPRNIIGRRQQSETQRRAWVRSLQQLHVAWPALHRIERRPDLWGHYPTDPRALPPGMENADMITIAYIVDGRPVGGFTWAIRAKGKLPL